MTGIEISAQALYLLIENSVELIIPRVEQEIIQKRLLPLIFKSLECKVDALQDMALSRIPDLLKSIDPLFIRSSVIPRIIASFEVSSNAVKLNTIVCLNKLLSYCDQATLTNIVVPSLLKISSEQHGSNVQLAIFRILESISSRCD